MTLEPERETRQAVANRVLLRLKLGEIDPWGKRHFAKSRLVDIVKTCR